MKRCEFLNLSGMGIWAATAASFTSNAKDEAPSPPLDFLVPTYLQEPSPDMMTVMWFINTRDTLS
jgi:hypothetical protein